MDQIRGVKSLFDRQQQRHDDVADDDDDEIGRQVVGAVVVDLLSADVAFNG